MKNCRKLEAEVNEYLKGLEQYCQKENEEFKKVYEDNRIAASNSGTRVGGTRTTTPIDKDRKKKFEQICIRKNIVIVMGGWAPPIKNPIKKHYDYETTNSNFASFMNNTMKIPIDSATNTNSVDNGTETTDTTDVGKNRKVLHQIQYFYGMEAYIVFPGAAKQLLYGGVTHRNGKLVNQHRAINLPADVYMSFAASKDSASFYNVLPNNTDSRYSDEQAILMLQIENKKDRVFQGESFKEAGGSGDIDHTAFNITEDFIRIMNAIYLFIFGVLFFIYAVWLIFDRPKIVTRFLCCYSRNNTNKSYCSRRNKKTETKSFNSEPDAECDASDFEADEALSLLESGRATESV